jgi:hypothetical protein
MSSELESFTQRTKAMLSAPPIQAGLLALLVLILYWPATGNEFSAYDDLTYYPENAQV